MGYLKYVREAWKRPEDSELYKPRLIQWRKEPVTLRLEHPTRPDRARSLGYRAKQGYIIVRQKVLRGGHMRPKGRRGARRPKTSRRRLVLNIGYQRIAEARAAEGFPNCEVLNSYWVGQDGKSYWYEVILIDRAHPVILSDPHISWIGDDEQKGRVSRGLTSAGKKARGLRWKGQGSESARPSRAAIFRRKTSHPRKDAKFMRLAYRE